MGAQASLHLEALDELLTPHGLSLLNAADHAASTSGALGTADILLAAVQLLGQKLMVERQAQHHLVHHHDELRLRCARKEANLRRAHDVVGKAALTYHDEGLALLARDLHGRPYREALDALPTAHTLLKLGRQGLVG